MTADSWRPRALIGGPIFGNRWVKQCLLDEAGINARDPVVVVAGVIVDPDSQFVAVERRIDEAREALIPEHIRDGFAFHAKDVFGRLRKQEGWDWKKCNEITQAWFQIALDLKLPIVLTWVAKNLNEAGICEVNEEAHMLAFAECIQGIDDYMREFASDEVASVIAEDCPHMRKRLRHMAKKIMRGGLIGDLNFTEKINHIKGGVLFAEKDDSPILQIADAFAFSFSRYVNRRPGGSGLWHKMNGSPRTLVGPSIPDLGGGRLLLWPK